MGKFHTPGRVHQVQIKQAGALRQVLAHAQLRVKGKTLEGEPGP